MSFTILAFTSPISIPRAAHSRALTSSSNVLRGCEIQSGHATTTAVAVRLVPSKSNNTRRARVPPKPKPSEAPRSEPKSSTSRSSRSSRSATSAQHESSKSFPTSPSSAATTPQLSKAVISKPSPSSVNIASKQNTKKSRKLPRHSSNSDIHHAGDMGNAEKNPDLSLKTEEPGTSPSLPTITAEESSFLNQRIAERQAQKQAAEKLARKKEKRAPRKRHRRPRATTTAAPADTFRAYMVDISRNDLLDAAQISTLARDIRAGVLIERAQRELQTTTGRRPTVPQVAKKLEIPVEEVQRRLMLGTAAKNVLVSANLRLVSSVAGKLSKSKSGATPGITLDDMVQEGSVGLIRAAEKFDASRGYRFSTYATWWIRAYVIRSITNQGRSIKVPSSVVDEYARIRKIYARYLDESLPRPTEEQVANELGITVAKMRFVINVVTQVPASLDTPIGNNIDGGQVRVLGELIPGEDHVEEKMVEEMERKELDIAMKKYLRPVERAVVRLRFGLEDGQPRSFRETGELLGLSKERIRQVVFSALPKLRNAEIQQMLLDATTR